MKSQVGILLLVLACVMTANGKQLHGDTAANNQDYIYSDTYKQSKTPLIQNNDQTEYYGFKQSCPTAEDIAPCVCTYNSESKSIDLDCSAVEDEDQLSRIFSSEFPFKNFRKLSIQNNNNLKVLESSLFNDVSFEEIQVVSNNLEVIEIQALDSCYETVNYIDFYGNKITTFPFDELSQFSKLTYLDIGGNSLNMIPIDAFNGLRLLQRLDISHNTPNIIGKFENLLNLEAIFIGGNELITIQTNFINTGSFHLENIDLNSNHIVSVEPGAFDIVEGLRINMRYNSLSTLEEATWRPLLEVPGGELWANDNPLACGCDLAWLFKEKQLLSQVSYGTSCSDGTYIHDLDPSIFDDC